MLANELNSAESLRGNFQTNFCNNPFPDDPTSLIADFRTFWLALFLELAETPLVVQINVFPFGL